MSKLLFVMSTMFGVVAYLCYYLDIKKETIKPNRWSWLIWSVATAIEALTYNALSEDPLKTWMFFISAGCCVIITTLIWTKAAWQKPDWTEVICVVMSLIAIVVWQKFGMAKWAHYLTLIALPIAFLPTFESAWKDFHKENNPSWMLWTIGDALAIVLVIFRLEKVEELPYAIVECVCHGAVWFIVYFRRKTPE